MTLKLLDVMEQAQLTNYKFIKYPCIYSLSKLSEISGFYYKDLQSQRYGTTS